MPSLLETAKLKSVNPQDWLADVLDRIGQGYRINRIDELLPWNWSFSQTWNHNRFSTGRSGRRYEDKPIAPDPGGDVRLPLR